MSIHGILKIFVLVTHLGGYHVSIQKLLDDDQNNHYFLGTLCQTFLEINKKDPSSFHKDDLQEFSTNIIRY